MLQDFIRTTRVATRGWILQRTDEEEGEDEWGWGSVRLGRLLRTLCGQYKILRGSSSRRELNLGLG